MTLNTLQFLKRVLPTNGFFVITVISDTGVPQQGFFQTPEDLASACLRSDANGRNTYFAISTFRKRGNRKKENVHATKVLALDVDCAPDKPYLDQKAGLIALLKFVQDTGLPKPMVVSSGRGLHVYWVLDQALPHEQWEPLALRLKQATVDHEFKVDAGLTANAALVLRPVGTHNPKNGAEVNVLIDAGVNAVSTLENMLQRYNPSTAPATTAHVPPPPANRKGFGNVALLDALAVNQEFPPAAPAEVVSKCQQVRWCVENQDKVDEPLWYSLMGIAAHCVDPEGTAKDWSKGHASYSEAETLKKVNQWTGNTTGPSTCKRFEDLRPKGCDGCKLRGKIKTPATIGGQYDIVVAPFEAPDVEANTVKLPPTFNRVRTKAGKQVIAQRIEGTDVVICPFNIYPTGYGRDEGLGYETVRFKWDRQHEGWTDLSFRQAYLTDSASREFNTALADQGIVLTGKKQTETFQFMLRSYMDNLREMKAMTNLHATMGWKEDFSQFVLGDRIIRREADGSVEVHNVQMASHSNRQGSELYQKAGSLEAWVKATALFENGNLPHLAFTMLQGFAAPLWAYTGLSGVSISLFGKTGGGKSVGQLWEQSIYGPPEKLHFKAKFTMNALFSRMGLYCNLPMSIDEATVMQRDFVGEFCYMVTQGQDKARLSRSSEERAPRTWATNVTLSTNLSLASMMVSAGLDTSAQMARLLEITVPVNPIFAETSDAGRKIVSFLNDNHGVVGERFLVEFMKLSVAERKEYIRKCTDEFSTEFGVTFTGPERYWEACFVLTYTCAKFAFERGLIAFDYKKVIAIILQQLDLMRRTVTDNEVDAFGLVHEYVIEHAHELLTVMHTDDTGSAVDQNRLPRGEVRIRADVYRKSAADGWDRGTMMLVRRPFKEWLASRGYDYGLWKKEIKGQGADATPASNKFWMGRDTGLKFGQLAVFGVNLAHPDFHGYLQDPQLAPEDTTFGTLTEVK